MTGYVQVYTGNGKGKSTAAFGLALRAAGAQLKVYIAQFLKAGDYSEIVALSQLNEFITIQQYGAGRFVKNAPSPPEIESAQTGLAESLQHMLKGTYDMVILDEANMAVFFKLFPVEKLLEFIEQKPPGVELIITGRNAHEKIIDRADLVTEMREIKHYYQKGVIARTGIEK